MRKEFVQFRMNCWYSTSTAIKLWCFLFLFNWCRSTLINQLDKLACAFQAFIVECVTLETLGGLLFASSQWSVLVSSLTSLLFIESVVPWMNMLSSHKKVKEKKKNEALRQRLGHKMKRFECCFFFLGIGSPAWKRVVPARPVCTANNTNNKKHHLFVFVEAFVFCLGKKKIHWWAPGRS